MVGEHVLQRFQSSVDPAHVKPWDFYLPLALGRPLGPAHVLDRVVRRPARARPCAPAGVAARDAGRLLVLAAVLADVARHEQVVALRVPVPGAGCARRRLPGGVCGRGARRPCERQAADVGRAAGSCRRPQPRLRLVVRSVGPPGVRAALDCRRTPLGAAGADGRRGCVPRAGRPEPHPSGPLQRDRRRHQAAAGAARGPDRDRARLPGRTNGMAGPGSRAADPGLLHVRAAVPRPDREDARRREPGSNITQLRGGSETGGTRGRTAAAGYAGLSAERVPAPVLLLLPSRRLGLAERRWKTPIVRSLDDPAAQRPVLLPAARFLDVGRPGGVPNNGRPPLLRVSESVVLLFPGPYARCASSR